MLDRGSRALRLGRRTPETRSMRDGRYLIGQGVAAASFMHWRWPGKARVTLNREGSALVEAAAHDIGTGTYTVMAQVAADALGLTFCIKTIPAISCPRCRHSPHGRDLRRRVRFRSEHPWCQGSGGADRGFRGARDRQRGLGYGQACSRFAGHRRQAVMKHCAPLRWSERK
jgi:Molybdopterin-binding domain of aldehyde dehydrogenase